MTITTDRLGRRCLEPTLPRVKDSFVKKPRWSHAGACNALAVSGAKSADHSPALYCPSRGADASLRRWAWTNPHPDKAIRSLEVVSAGTEAGPILAAITGVT